MQMTNCLKLDNGTIVDFLSITHITASSEDVSGYSKTYYDYKGKELTVTWVSLLKLFEIDGKYLEYNSLQEKEAEAFLNTEPKSYFKNQMVIRTKIYNNQALLGLIKVASVEVVDNDHVALVEIKTQLLVAEEKAKTIMNLKDRYVRDLLEAGEDVLKLTKGNNNV